MGYLTLLLEQDDACRGVFKNPKGARALVFETTLLLRLLPLLLLGFGIMMMHMRMYLNITHKFVVFK